MPLLAPFSIDTWDAVPDEPVADADAPATALVVMRKTYRGDRLAGTAAGHVLTTMGPHGASYVAQERIVGTLDGRAGSFVLEHRALMGEGYEPASHAMVVPGSGTGALSGLRGSGSVEHELLTLEIELPEA